MRESWEIVNQTQTPKYVSRFELLLYVPAFTQKIFHYVHTHKGTFTKELQIQPGVHNSSLSPLHKRKAQSLAQSKEKNTT